MTLRLTLLACLLLSPGCGWYYLDPDPNQVAVGARTPSFSLPNRYGETVALEDLLADDHNAAIVFYRGHW